MISRLVRYGVQGSPWLVTLLGISVAGGVILAGALAVLFVGVPQ